MTSCNYFRPDRRCWCDNSCSK